MSSLDRSHERLQFSIAMSAQRGLNDLMYNACPAIRLPISMKPTYLYAVCRKEQEEEAAELAEQAGRVTDPDRPPVNSSDEDSEYEALRRCAPALCFTCSVAILMHFLLCP